MTDTKRKVIKDDDEFDVKKFLSRFIDHWKLFTISIIFFLLLGFLFIRYSTPLYRVHAQVLVQDDQNNSAAASFMGSTQLQDFSSLFSIQSNVSNELAIIQTRDLMEKMVREMNLNISYYRKGRIRSVELFDKSPFSVSFIPSSDSILETTFHISSISQGTANKFVIKNPDLNISQNLKWGDTLYTSIGKICI